MAQRAIWSPCSGTTCTPTGGRVRRSSGPLTLLFDEALHAPDPADRFQRLRILGDGILYGCGFFGDHFEARGVDAKYLRGLGREPYGAAGSMLRRAASDDPACGRRTSSRSSPRTSTRSSGCWPTWPTRRWPRASRVRAVCSRSTSAGSRRGATGSRARSTSRGVVPTRGTQGRPSVSPDPTAERVGARARARRSQAGSKRALERLYRLDRVAERRRLRAQRRRRRARGPPPARRTGRRPRGQRPPRRVAGPPTPRLELDTLCQIIEGVSHFVYVVERARAWGAPRRSSSSKLQAEVDKWVVLAASIRSFDARPERDAAGAALRGLRLRPRRDQRGGAELAERYRVANDVAHRFVRRLERDYVGRARFGELHAELWRFFHIGQEGKLRLDAPPEARFGLSSRFRAHRQASPRSGRPARAPIQCDGHRPVRDLEGRPAPLVHGASASSTAGTSPFETRGIEHVPTRGRAMLVGNHSGRHRHRRRDGRHVVPARDGPAAAGAGNGGEVHQPPALPRRVGEPHRPPDRPARARRAAARGRPAAPGLPRGARGTAKLFKDRNSLVDFGSGFIRLGLKTRTPIVPVAVLGGGEAFPTIANSYKLGRAFGVPYVPIVAYGLPVALPAKIEIEYAPPMHFNGTGNEDDEVVHGYVDKVKEVIARDDRRRRGRRRGEPRA